MVWPPKFHTRETSAKYFRVSQLIKLQLKIFSTSLRFHVSSFSGVVHDLLFLFLRMLETIYFCDVLLILNESYLCLMFKRKFFCLSYFHSIAVTIVNASYQIFEPRIYTDSNYVLYFWLNFNYNCIPTKCICMNQIFKL